MNIKKIVVLGIIASMVSILPTSAFAETKTWTNPNNYVWKPDSGSMSAYKYTSSGKNYIHADINFKYGSSQRTSIINSGYYPTVEIKVDGGNPKLQGLSYSTTMPDPKSDYDSCYYSTFSAICEIEVASKSPSSIVANTNYYLGTEWGYYPSYNTGAPYLISWGSPSREPKTWECAIGQCELNTVDESLAKSLQGFYDYQISGSTTGLLESSISALEEEYVEEQQGSRNESAEQVVVPTEYVTMNARDALDMYAEKKKNQVKEIVDEELLDFTLTFKEEELDDLKIKKYAKDIQELIVHGRGYNSNGERVTFGVFAVDDETLNSVKSNLNYQFGGYTEISGKAKGSEIKKLLNDKNVYTVEVAKDGTIPMGLFWKLENTTK